MKKWMLFLLGFILLVVMCGTLMLASAIYDSGNKTAIDAYFFQKTDNYKRRPGDVQTAEDYSVEDMRIQFITKYLTEYFFVTPDVSQLEVRMNNRSTLRLLSTAAVFNKWKETVAPELLELAKKSVLRTVSVLDAKFISETKWGEYWQVQYELKTWDAPNNFSVVPRTETATLFMDITYEPGMRDKIKTLNQSLGQYLENGGDPAVAFRFGVRDVVIQGQMDE